MLFQLKTVFFAGLLALGGIAHAAQQAHVHGEAQLNIAVDGEHLIIELESPAMNLLGFEHEPRNDKQQQKVQQVKKTLSQAKQLFSLPAKAKCELEETEIHMFEDDEHKEAHHDKHEHDEHKHEKHAHEETHHDEHKHEKHDHEAHGHDKHNEENHSDVYAHYNYHCDKPAELKTLQVHLIKHFPLMEHIEVQALSPAGQTSLELEAGKTEIKL